MAATISCKPKNIDVSAIRFGDMKTLDSGGKMAYLNYMGGKFYIQTPFMPLPYGVNDSTEMDTKAGRVATGPKRFDMNLSFRDLERNPAVKSLHDKLYEIGERVVDTGFEKRQAWFRNDYKGMREFVENMFSPIVRVSTDKETNMPSTRYPPTLKIKLPYDAASDSFKFECIDSNKQPVNFNDIKDNLKGATAQVLFQVTGVWSSAGKFGCSTKAIKVKIEQAIKADVDFEEDSDDERVGGSEDEDLVEDVVAATMAAAPKKAAAAPAPAAKKTAPAPAAPAPPLLEDSDEEEQEAVEEEQDEDSEVEEEEEHEPTPPPPPPKKPTKKVVTAKK